MEYLMPLWLRQYITQRQKRGTSEIPEDIAQHILHVCAQALYQRDPATLIEPRTISAQQSFHRILHPSTRNHGISTASSISPSSPASSPSIRASKFPFSSTPSMFKAVGPRDLDTLNSQEVVRLAVYVMKRSKVELADPILCERIHTEGEKKRSAAAAGEGLKRGAISGSGSRKGATAESTNNNITASSIYLTKDFDVGNSVLHHRSRRPSRSLESVLSIATFCARASRPSASQEARRASGGSSSGGSDHGHGGGSSSSLRGSGGGVGRQAAAAGAGMVGAKWLAKLGQVVFGGPCTQAGHSHHRRTKTSLEPLNSSNKNDSSSTPTEKLCKNCSGAMTCLAISILREASASTTSSSSTNNILSSTSGQGNGNGASGREGGDAENTTSGAATALQDSGFDNGSSGFEFLDAQSDNVASETSSTSSSMSPPTISPQLLSSSAGAGVGSPRHGQSSFSTSRGGASPGMNEDYRPQLELKHKTREPGVTPNMYSSPAGSGSPFIVFDRSHLNDTTIRHPLESDTDDHFLLQHQHQHSYDHVEEYEAGGDGDGAWSPTSSILSDSIAAAFGPDVATRGDYRSNMRSGMSTPRVVDLAERGHEDSNDEDVPLGKQTRSRLERDLAEALGTPVLEPLSSPSSPAVIVQPAPAPAQPAATLLAPSSFRRPSVTGLGIHARTTLTNGGDSDDDNDEVFHQAVNHFIHPLSTSPHFRVLPRTAPPTTVAKSPRLEPLPSNYSSPPNPPITGAPALESPTATMDDVATPILEAPSADFKVEDKEDGDEEGKESLNPRLLYGVGINGRVSVDEYAQEIGESMQRSPPVDYSRSIVDAEQEEESKEGVEGATADGGVVVVVEEENEMTKPEKSSTTDNTSTAEKIDNDVAAEASDVEDEVIREPTKLTSAPTSNNQEDQSTVSAERRRSTLRYGAVGLHALTPSDVYVQDIEKSMQRTPPVDVSQPSDLENDDIVVGEVEEEDLVPLDTTTTAAKPTTSNNEDEDEVQTDDEASNAATAVLSAIDRIEDESVATAEAKGQLAIALRYGAVGLHGKTPFDEYAHEIEESIQRRAGPGAHVEEQYGGSLVSPVVIVGEGARKENNGTVIEDRKGLANERNDLGSGSDSDVIFAQGHTNVSASSPFTTTNKINTSFTRPLSSISTLGSGESTASDTSSLDYDLYDLDLDDLDNTNLTSPTTQTAIHKELYPLRSQQHQQQQQQRRRRKKFQLVDDAQRKKEQLDRIQAQLERRTLGKIREQVSFWETKGVLEQKVVGAEVLDDNDDDGESNDKDKGEGKESSGSIKAEVGGGGATAIAAKKLQSLLLTQEHLRGIGNDREFSGEPLSPGNGQSPGYGEMPQVAPRRSLPTSTSASSSSSSSLSSSAKSTRSSIPSTAPQPDEMDLFLSNID